MSLAVLFHLLCVQHVSDINISIIRSLWLFLLNYHIGRIVLGSMCVGVSAWLGWSGIRVVVIQQKKSQAPDDGYINVRNMLNTQQVK